MLVYFLLKIVFIVILYCRMNLLINLEYYIKKYFKKEELLWAKDQVINSIKYSVIKARIKK